MTAWFRKLRAWPEQSPGSFAGALLLLSPILSIFAYAYDGIVENSVLDIAPHS